ncbi:hypothetical protein DY000_02010961 [Brassica cretica]|uniref:Uncharacterized protein n=1 Tax=Brassica cretica TaxID=69181 RepID=A0ABQ7D114_BRACR|nr:hypothetical protein DY000_02010961 [Brassica cretica]
MVTQRAARFTFFTFFTSHPDYDRLLHAAWTSISPSFGPMSTLYNKLRAAKSCCKDKEDMQQMVIRFYSYLQGRSNAAVEIWVFAVKVRLGFCSCRLGWKRESSDEILEDDEALRLRFRRQEKLVEDVV